MTLELDNIMPARACNHSPVQSSIYLGPQLCSSIRYRNVLRQGFGMEIMGKFDGIPFTEKQPYGCRWYDKCVLTWSLFRDSTPERGLLC